MIYLRYIYIYMVYIYIPLYIYIVLFCIHTHLWQVELECRINRLFDHGFSLLCLMFNAKISGAGAAGPDGRLMFSEVGSPKGQGRASRFCSGGKRGLCSRINIFQHLYVYIYI